MNEFMNCTTDQGSSNESSNELQQWQEVMPPAELKNITVGQLKKYLLTEDMSEQQQHRLATEGKMYSQVLMDPECEINPDDFLQAGRLSMIYVPNYIYVPPLAIEILTGSTQISPQDTLILWKRMKLNRDRAAVLLASNTSLWPEHEHPMPELNTPWLHLAQEAPNKPAWSPDTKSLQRLDELQHTSAHLYWEQNCSIRICDNKNINVYDLFIRPMEHLFASNRPLSQQMIDAMHDSIKAVWLTKQIAHLAGIEKWISPTYHPLFEISQIRHLSAEQLAAKFDPSCSPYQRLPPLQFITMTPPRPSKNDNQDLVPRVEDFNTGGAYTVSM